MNENNHAREVARRTNGQFGEQPRSEPEVSLAAATRLDPQPEFPGALHPGDLVELEGSRADGPFSFAFQRNRRFRTALKAAGRPQRVPVEAVRIDTDEPSDVLVTFDIGGEPVELSFHNETSLLSTRNEAA